MELFTLNSNYQRVAPVDWYESLIWTDRFSAWGDFELVAPTSRTAKTLLTPGTYLGMSESKYVQVVETVIDTVDNEGRSILKFTGRSLEACILDSRLARGANGGTTANPKWTITDKPDLIAKKIFHDICVTGILDAGDVIPLIFEGDLDAFGSIAFPTDTITYEIEPKSVYQALKDLCDIYHMGFKLHRVEGGAQLWFGVYMGKDRTTKQTDFDSVVFGPSMENLQRPTELDTISLYKNVAYVISPVGSEKVYDTDIPTTVNGIARKVLIVKADDITDTTPSVATAKMIQRGKQELSKNRRFAAFDGEISQRSSYIYGVNYGLGDLVELQNTTGGASEMQVTEQIFVSDKEGVRAYPTLSINRFIMPGTWLAQPVTKVWQDGGATEYWSNS